MKLFSNIALLGSLILILSIGAPPVSAQVKRELLFKKSPSGVQQRTSTKNPAARQSQETREIVIPKPAKETPLAPEIKSEFQKARTMTVAEYLQIYGAPDTQSDYKVGPMDVLSIKIYQEPELSLDEARVSARGTISLPLLTELKVKGLSPRQIEKLIKKRYREGGILKHPQAAVHVKEFKGQKVLIFGAVNTPGRHSMEGNERLAEMLAKAGGIKFDADGDIAANKIRILRKVKEKNKKPHGILMELDLESMTRGDHPEYNLVMQDGDVIYVPEAPRFFVTGQVKSPGYYKIKDRAISVVEAITMAGGLTRLAAGNRTRLVRRMDGKEVTLKVPVEDILDGDKSQDVIVRPNDVIVVPESYF